MRKRTNWLTRRGWLLGAVCLYRGCVPLPAPAAEVAPYADTDTGALWPPALEARVVKGETAHARVTTGSVARAALADVATTAGTAAGAATVTGPQSDLIAGAVQATGTVYTQTVALAGSAVQPDVLATARVDYATSSGTATTAVTAASADYATSAGTAATATNATYVLGPEAWITMSGTTGLLYRVESNGVGYVVTGTLDPDATGTYRATSQQTGGKTVYAQADNSWYLWWLPSFEHWTISTTTIEIAEPYWSRTQSTDDPAEGAYTAHGATGDATVTRVTNLPQTNSYAIATLTDLANSLAAYSTNGHGHAIADVDGLQDALNTIPDEAEIESIAESAAETVAQTAPEWIALTNLSASIILTNQYERPILLYSTGTVSVAFAGLRPPQALYCVIRGPDALTFPGAHLVGGGSWQTNAANHFLIWQYGTNLMVHPVTTTTLED